MVETTRHRIETKGQDVLDLTPLVSRVLDGSSMKAGLATVAVVGSTAGITAIEFEPGAVADLNRVWEQLAPRDGDDEHHLRWGDDNGSSHVRAAMLGPSRSIPFDNGRLCVGTWRQIVLIEFDTWAQPGSRHPVDCLNCPAGPDTAPERVKTAYAREIVMKRS